MAEPSSCRLPPSGKEGQASYQSQPSHSFAVPCADRNNSKPRILLAGLDNTSPPLLLLYKLSPSHIQPNTTTANDDESWTDPFDMNSTKYASVERLKRWRKAALVLNSSRRFQYTLNLKKEEEKKQILRKIRAHAQAIRAASLYTEVGNPLQGTLQPIPSAAGDFQIAHEQLVSVIRDRDLHAMQQYGGIY